MRFNRVFSVELVAVMGASAAVGFLLGIGLASSIFVARASDLSIELKQKAVRVALLESLVSMQPEFNVLDGPALTLADVVSGPPSAPIVEPAVAPSAPIVQAPAPAPRVTAKDPVSAQAVAPRLPLPAVTSKSSIMAIAPPTRPPLRSSPAPPAEVVPSEEIAAAVAGSKVEGVSAEKARVERLTAEGVYLRSGKLVRPGERFSSGEMLLQVDPANNRIVTSDRQLLLFFNN